MEPQHGEQLLDVLIENTSRILNAPFGVDRAEPTMVQIVDLIREVPSLKEALLARIAAALAEVGAGAMTMHPQRELVEIVAHEFRWSELRDLAEQRLVKIFNGDQTAARGDIYYNILSALEDDWEDRDFYKRYRSPE